PGVSNGRTHLWQLAGSEQPHQCPRSWPRLSSPRRPRHGAGRGLSRGGRRDAHCAPMSRWLLVALVLLSVGGLLAVASLAAAGPEPRWRWGYVAATHSFLLSACQLAPVVSMASRVGRGYWGAALRRLADVLGLSGLVSAPILIVLLRQLPEWRSRPSVWFDWPAAPGLWDGVAGVGLALAGAALVWVGTWPERRGLGWAGTPAQWRVLTRGVIALGGLYTLLVVFVHLLVSSDLGLSLVPGWHSTVIPAYHVVSGFEAAVALVVLGLAVVRGLDARTARSCSKLLLA